MKDFAEIKKHFKDGKHWGLCTSLDLLRCNQRTIRSEIKIKDYVDLVCNLLEMKRFGDCEVINFGSDERVEGFSMTQFIETSLISGHFANKTNNAYIDIFSCAIYNPFDITDFSKNYFKAQEINVNIFFRK